MEKPSLILMVAPILAATLVLLSCEIMGPDVEIAGRQALVEIPVQYRVWHGQVEQCVNDVRSFDGIKWFVADEVIFDGRSAVGLFKKPDEITVLRVEALSVRIVKHEMIHYVRQEVHHGPVYQRCS